MTFDPMRGLTQEGPDTAEAVKIIALEFTLHHYGSGVQQELEMFPCGHTIARDPHGYCVYEAIITLHTSHGDRQVRGELRF